MKIRNMLASTALLALAAAGPVSAQQNQIPLNFLGDILLEVGPLGVSGGPDDDLHSLNVHARIPNANVRNASGSTTSVVASLPTPAATATVSRA
jgi:hypothetical protein